MTLVVFHDVRESNIWVYVTMFVIYTVFGAIAEHLAYYFSKRKKQLKNPILTGFPIYGIGAYLVVFIYRNFTKNANWFVEFLIYGTILTILEYIFGKLMGAGKNAIDECGYVKTWDYSNHFLNFQGIIDLQHFVIFGIFGLIVRTVHGRFVRLVNRAIG